MFFVSFTKGPGGFPYVFIITVEVPTLIPIDGITLGDHGVFVLGGDQEVLDGSSADSALPQAGNSQASLADSTLSQAESAVLPQAFLVVRFSARLRASQASQAGNTPNNSSSQAGDTPRADSTISQPDSKISQEARSSPLPNRHNSPQGPSSLEEPNPNWVINLSSKALTKAQRSVLAKGPNFAVSPKNSLNLEYITAIEAACTKLSQQNAEELRADINLVLRASHTPQT